MQRRQNELMSSKIIIHFDDIIIHNDNSELYNPLNYALPLLHIYCIDNYNTIFDCSYISYAQTYFRGLNLEKQIEVMKSNIYQPDINLYS